MPPVMTAYELRRHLASDHDVRISGADYDVLLALHDDDHRTAQDHDHEEHTDGA
jgi:hypothetical protein